LYKKPHDLDCIADDAVCALLYACDCELKGDIESAIGAAKRDYDLVSESIVDLDKRARRRIYRICARRLDISVADLIDYVQEELQEQISDLEELSSSKEHGTFSEVVQHVRHRAQRRAEVLRQIVKRIYEEQWLRPKSSHK
jgi:predicted CopG family antitoxin